MTPEELTANLVSKPRWINVYGLLTRPIKGTLAKSGTTEFLQKAESSTDATGTGNLIGAFGLGFYSR